MRKDSNAIVFNFQLEYVNKQPVLYIINAAERIKVNNIVVTKDDSVIIQMPVFESQFRAKLLNKTKLEGVWIKGGPKKNQIMPFFAVANDGKRFPVTAPANKNISGKWSVNFGAKANPAIAIFQQKGTQLSGSIVTPTGDYRYLSGVVNGDTLLLSTFDGGHAFSFSANINSNKTISNGKFYSGATSSETFTAIKNDTATLPDLAAMQVKDGEGKLNFSFKGLDGKFVSITDERFKNKVVIVQLMGSWCPNCMDETAYLTEFYNKNKQRGIEVIALAYELTDNFERSKISVQKFKDRFNVQYPILVTGVTVSDEKRTEKTLPQLTPIKVFPSTIILDKQGKVRTIDTGFFGPGTGEYFENFKKEFNKVVDGLVKE
ncbi:MAG: TlpA family protein disulfide reductase [Pedobacter sp.]|nr:TlpA family protein disulfide reductase [Chitinophagaceae bacterium]